MRLIVLLIMALVLSLANLPIVKAMPSVLTDSAMQRVYINSARNTEVQENINKQLANIKLNGSAPDVLINNVSVISMMLNTTEGKKAITFDVYTGDELKITDIISFNDEFKARVAAEPKEISGYAIANNMLLIEKNSSGKYEQVPFSEIITAININKLAGCFNIHNINENANGMSIQVATGDLIAIVLPADKLKGEAWRNNSSKNNPILIETGRSYIMANPRAEEYGYEIIVFSVARAGSYDIQMGFEGASKKAQKNFTLNVLVR